MESLHIATDGTRRVLVVANNSGIVYAFRRVLRQTSGFTLVGYVAGHAPVGAIVADARPDVVIVDDLGAPTEAVKRIAEVHGAVPGAKVVLLVPDTSLDWIEDAVRSGAHAVLSKTIDPVSAGTLLREIVRGTVFHCLADSTVRAGRITQESGTAHESLGLTQRELELLRLVASGATNSRLARQLFVTEQTVKFHLSNIYRKLGVANRTQASRFAYQHGLVPTAISPDADATADVVMRAA
ncbi:MAG TPA: response regulator transcription factor [Solirubrobacteraceae bacterium]